MRQHIGGVALAPRGFKLVGRGNLSRAVARKFKPEECLFDFARLPDFNPLPAEAVLPLLAPASLRKTGGEKQLICRDIFVLS